MDVVNTDSLDTAVRLEREAIIEGQVNVALHDPKVSSDQREAEVSIKSEALNVNVCQGQSTIEVRQA